MLLLALAWRGEAATRVKDNDTGNLDLGTSWVGGTKPGSSDIAKWDSTFQSFNNSAAIGSSESWLGMLVTNNLNADYTIASSFSSTLTLGLSGIDMSSANRNFTIDCDVALGRDQTWTVNSSRTLTIGGVLSGASTNDLTKAGAGTLTLDGANTFSGALNISAGTVKAGNAAALGATSGTTTIASGAILDLNGYNLAGEHISAQGTGVGGNGAIVNNGSDVVQGMTHLTLTGNLTVGGTGRWDLRSSDSDPANASLSSGGQAYNLTKVGSGLFSIVTATVDPNLGDINLQEGSMLFEGNSTSLGDATKTLTVSSGASFNMWAATNQLNKNIVLSAGGKLRNSSGDNTILGPITLNGTGTLDVAGTTLTLKGAIGGTGGIIKSNTGTLILTGTNTFSGSLTISDGILQVGNGGASGTLGTGNVINNSELIFDRTGTLTATNVISGSGTLTKNGSSTLTLSGNNTFSGDLTLNAGTLALGHDNANGSGGLNINGGTIQGSGSGTRTINEALTVGANFSISGTQSLTLSGAWAMTGSRTLTVDNTGVSTLSGVISDSASSYSLTKNGAGDLVISGANTYDGGFTLNAGRLGVGHTNALGDGGTLTINGGDIYNSTAGALTLSRTLSLGGDFIVSGSQNLTFSGGATLTANSAITVNNSATTTFSGAITNGGRLLTVGGTGNATVSSVISGTGGLTKTGAGTLTLSGASANTFSGAVTVNQGTLLLSKTAGQDAYAGTLTVGDGTGGANADIVRLTANNQMPGTAVTINSSGWLDLNGSSDTIGALTMTGGNISSGAGTLTLGGTLTGNADASTATISGNLALGANRIFTIADGAAATDMDISAVISGSGNTLVKGGAGKLVLSGANTYSGATTISNGVLNMQNAAALGANAANATVISGAALELEGGIAVGTKVLTLNGSGISSGGALRNVSGSNSWAGNLNLGSASTIASDAGTFTLSGNLTNGTYASTFSGAGNVTVSGVISGSSGLTKSGTGTLMLSGNNTLTGALAVNAGTLLLGSNNRLADAATMTLNGGTFATGGNNETLGTLTLTANSFIDFGSSTSVVHFANSSGVSWTGGTMLIITNWTGSYAGGGPDQLFFGSGTNGLTGSQLAKIEFTDGAGHRQLANILSSGEVVPVPEPATVVAVGMLILGLGWHERRRLMVWVRRKWGRA